MSTIIYPSLIIVLWILIKIKEGGSLDGTLVALGFMMSAVLQLFAFCWGGNIILVESDKTSTAIYSSHWYDRDIVYRNNIKVFLSVVRNPLIVSAGGLFDLSAVTFKNVCHIHSYIISEGTLAN